MKLEKKLNFASFIPLLVEVFPYKTLFKYSLIKLTIVVGS